jgi:hypothetical protein
LRDTVISCTTNKAIHYKRERRPITLELQEREEHLIAARNYGEEAEEKETQNLSAF